MYATPVLGLDVSVHQGRFPWNRARDAGIRYAWIKTTEGVGYVDPWWSWNWQGAVTEHIPWGGYHFARANGPDWWADAIAEADAFINAGGMNGNLPGVLDMEHTSLGREDTIRWAAAWCERVRARTGRLPVVYWGAYFATDGGPACMNDPRLSHCLWWMPAYPHTQAVAHTNLPGWVPAWNGRRKPDIWQWTSTGRIPGYQGNLDLNVCEEATLAAMLGEPPAPPLPLTDEEIEMHVVFCKGVEDHVSPHTGWECWRDGAGRRWRRGYTDLGDLELDDATGLIAGSVEVTGDQALRFLRRYTEAPAIPPGAPRLGVVTGDSAWGSTIAGLAPGETARFYWVPDAYVIRVANDDQWNADRYVGVPDAGVLPDAFLFNQPLLPGVLDPTGIDPTALEQIVRDAVEAAGQGVPVDVQALVKALLTSAGQALTGAGQG